MPDKLIFDRVSVSYVDSWTGAEHIAVGSASFSIPEGGFLAVIGRSGSGKSTLLRAAAGLITYRSGSILLDDTPVSCPGDRSAVVFQSARLLPWRTVAKNVSLGLEVRGESREAMRARVAEALALVELDAWADKFPNMLSGGMQQRVNLARAIVLDADLLLLDEPFSALDAQTREMLGSELLKIFDATRKTSLFVTHQIDEAIFLADKVVVLSEGPSSVVTQTIDIDLPRPRDSATRLMPEYGEYIARLREAIFASRGENGQAGELEQSSHITS